MAVAVAGTGGSRPVGAATPQAAEQAEGAAGKARRWSGMEVWLVEFPGSSMVQTTSQDNQLKEGAASGHA